MTVPAAVALAASLAARDHGGIVAYQIHRTGDVSAAFFRRHDDVTLAVVFDNDKLTNVRVLRDQINGRPAGAAAEQALTRELLTNASAGAFAVPFDTRHLNEYHYRVEGDRVWFAADARDAQHANGFFQLAPNGAVAELQYTPNVLPRFATGGTVREERAEVLPRFWATVRSVESYDGRYGLFRGHAEFVTTNTDYHRFADTAAAMAWLQAERV